MNRNRLALSLPLVGLLALAACDSRDYEAEIGELQTQLEQAQAELESARAENETMSSEMEEMRTQMSEAESAGGGGPSGEVLNQLEGQLNTIATAATRSLDQIDQLAQSGEQNVADAAGAIKEDLQEVVQSVHAAATSLGVPVEAAVEGGVQPAAGPQQGGGDQPAAGAQEAPAAGATQEEPAAGQSEEQQPTTQQ